LINYLLQRWQTHFLTHDQQAATQDSTTGTGTHARYDNWV